MEARLHLIDGSIITIDNETYVDYDDMPVGDTKDDLCAFYYDLMDKSMDPSIFLIKGNTEYHFPRKSISHFEILSD